MAAARAQRELAQKTVTGETRPALVIYAVDAKKERSLVGVSLTEDGARQRVREVANQYPGCMFVMADTELIML